MKKQRLLLHILLFLVTVFTTMLAGAEHLHNPGFFLEDLFYNGTFPWREFADGWLFSLCFLLFLTVHEFGHYGMAVYHRVRATLPFYIPVFIPFSLLNIGSFGAVIRIKEMPGSRRKYFDIGVAGPLAGFVVSVVLLVIGFLTLPDLYSYVGQFHPVFQDADAAKTYSGILPMVGSNLLYDGLAAVLADPDRLPPPWELMHYPLLFSGYLTLFFTALNLLPIGQLDGGHVVYGLFGRRVHGWVSRGAVLLLVLVGGTGLMDLPAFDPANESIWSYSIFQSLKFLLYLGLLYLVARRFRPQWGISIRLLAAFGLFGLQVLAKQIFPGIEPNEIWLVYAFFSVTFIGLDHPATRDEGPLDWRRKVLGYIALAIFVACFSIAPIYLH